MPLKKSFRLFITLIVFSTILLPNLQASGDTTDPIEKDRQAIHAMEGCYRIKFQFKETFSKDPNYQFKKPYSAEATELIFAEKKSDNEIDLYHLLLTPMGVIKHWRQKWTYENQDFYLYRPGNSFEYRWKDHADVLGQWTQKVYQVDDSPRYECSGHFRHPAKGNSYWECQVDAPLPRREASRASEYNIMNRRNRHVMHAGGHTHEQDNIKIKEDEFGKRHELVWEKGLNQYDKIDPAKCDGARSWWVKNKPFWSDVVNFWDEVYNRNEDIRIREQIEEKKLWMVIFQLSKKYAVRPGTLYPREKAQKEIAETITSYLH